MQFSELVATSRRVAQTARRAEKIRQLAQLLRSLGPEELESGAAFLSGELRQGRVGMGPALLKTVLPVAARQASTLTILAVDRSLQRISETTGAGSSATRRHLLTDLLGQGTQEEQRFLSELLLGGLRQGALAGIMTEAVARAAGVTASEVRRAYMVTGNLPATARAALLEGASGLRRFSVTLLRPVQPMLAQSAEDMTDAMAQLGRAAVEYKLDGARVQVHKAGGEVRVFTRRLNDVTMAVPEIVDAVAALDTRELILDGEVAALSAGGTPHPFQVTMRRFGRKLDVARLREQLPLSAFFFDCLYVDGEDLTLQPAADRVAALQETLAADLLMPRLVTADPVRAEQFLRQALKRGHEGVMAKSLDAPYEAGSRGSAWLKVKPTRSLDLVVLAAEWGHGRRQGWLSNLHLGARDPLGGGFVMLGKTFKGMTDQMLAWQTQALLALEVARDHYTVYVRPELVVEVGFNDLQASPHYPAGLALRFARVKRYRPDKGAENADTIDTVRRIYEAQHPRA